MDYQPSLPEHNDNVSHEHPLKDFVLILSALAAIALLVFWLLGLMVDSMVDNLSPETEARLNSMLAVKADVMPKSALPQEAQVQALVDSMRQCAQLQTPATVKLIKSETPNAAVFQSGTIIVFSGLLEQVESENGLAFVLAHELAHIVQRDHLRAMGRGIVLVAISALVTGSDSGLTELLTPVGQLGEAKYSRGREASADSKALQILNCRYGHVGGATEFFKALKSKDNDTFALSHYVASHPAMQTRIDSLELAIKDGGLKTSTVLPLFGGAAR